MKYLALLPCAFALLLRPALAQKLTPEQIIEKFAAKESEFLSVWEGYTFTQRILIEVLGPGNEPRERREVIFEVFFTSDGKRETRKVSDRGQIHSVQMTQEDFEIALKLQPFVLTKEELPNYKLNYLGEERVDELDTYLFEVEPRKMRKGTRYFRGRIWVDKLDLQVVMLKGEVVPQNDRFRFPKFETVREQIDGQYWFPTWTLADEVLRFSGGNLVHIREVITNENYQKFDVGTSITYGPVEEKPETP